MSDGPAWRGLNGSVLLSRIRRGAWASRGEHLNGLIMNTSCQPARVRAHEAEELEPRDRHEGEKRLSLCSFLR